MAGVGATREERQQEQLRWDVAAELYGRAFHANAVNEYGSVVEEGYKVEDGPEGAARVSHKLPEADLSDPYRMSSDERWWVRLGMLARYAEALRRGGFEVEPSRPNGAHCEPWLIVRRSEEARCDAEASAVFGHSECVRDPGHEVPHRDAKGREWTDG